MTSCVVCGGTGQMVRLKPGHRTGDLIPCPNCAAREPTPPPKGHPMSTGFHIEYVPSRNMDRRSDRNTIDDKKQAVGSSSVIPGSNLLNRNRSVSEILADLSRPPAWHKDAPCAQSDPDAWFPEKGGSTADAKRICAGCDVREQCLQWALDNEERFGVWGGHSERERRRILAERRGDAA